MRLVVDRAPALGEKYQDGLRRDIADALVLSPGD
jgi:hypothetical protein